MDIVIEFLKEINIGQLVAIGLMFWFFYARLNGKIEKLDIKLSNRIDNLSLKIEDIDRRICRIEGSISTHGHCLLKHHNEKAD